MQSGKGYLKGDVIEWLQEETNPSVQYFTIRWLLGKQESDFEVKTARQAIASSYPVQKILSQQRPQGYWGSDSRPHHSTRGNLMLLRWLGYQGNGAVKKAMDYRINGCLMEDGSYGIELKGRTVLLPCHGANLLRLMLWYGYEEDDRTRKRLDWLVSIQDQAGVWYCVSKLKPFPCLWATASVLRAYQEIHPELVTHQVVQSRNLAIELFLNSNLYRYGKGKPSPRWFEFGFPLQWDTDILEVLNIVAPYISPNDLRIQDGLNFVMQKQDEQGRWPCEKHPKGGKWMQKYIEFEEIGKPSKWVTLHAMKLLKNLYSK